MKRISTVNFSFSTSEIKNNSNNKDVWHRFVRKKEAELIFNKFKPKQFKKGLEIGAGDGIQSQIVSSFCGEYICTYYSEDEILNHGKINTSSSKKNIKYLALDAHDLKGLKNQSFDLIYSSNVLEHLKDIQKALSEFDRVLRDDGLMIHVMPNRIWKISSFVLNLLLLTPQIKVHGSSKNHFHEFYLFGINRWLKVFKESGYEIVKLINMPFYTGTQNRLSFITNLGNRIGLSSSVAYFVKKR
ncbi:MAG: class I SAM-dependent methyltransferase [Candidatus Odinarchaeota archaeon]